MGGGSKGSEAEAAFRCVPGSYVASCPNRRSLTLTALVCSSLQQLGGPPLGNATDDGNTDSNKSAETADDPSKSPRKINSSPRKRKSIDGAAADSMDDSMTCMDSMGLRAARRKVSETGAASLLLLMPSFSCSDLSAAAAAR